MNLLIIEPEIKGHFISLYVRRVIKSFKNKDIKILILTSKKILSHESLKILRAEKIDFELHFMDELDYPTNKSFFNLVNFQIKNYHKIKKSFEEVFRKRQVDHVFLTSFEHFDKILSLLGSPFRDIPFSGIMVNPRHHHYYIGFTSDFFKDFVNNFLLKRLITNNKLNKVFTNDELFQEYIVKKYNKFHKKFLYFTEPVKLKKKYSNLQAKKKLNISKNFFIIMVYGALRESKSIIELIELVSKTKNNEIKIVLAGEQNDNIKKQLSNSYVKNLIKRGKIIVYDKFISTKKESVLFSAADALWCVYKDTPLGSSGVFFLANDAKLPIITNKHGLVGYYNKNYSLGPILDVDDNFQKSCEIIENLALKDSIYYAFIKNHIKFGNKISKHQKFSELISKNIK